MARWVRPLKRLPKLEGSTNGNAFGKKNRPMAASFRFSLQEI
jgi:hypothetical protein